MYKFDLALLIHSKIRLLLLCHVSLQGTSEFQLASNYKHISAGPRCLLTSLVGLNIRTKYLPLILLSINNLCRALFLEFHGDSGHFPHDFLRGFPYPLPLSFPTSVRFIKLFASSFCSSSFPAYIAEIRLVDFTHKDGFRNFLIFYPQTDINLHQSLLWPFVILS